MTRELAVHVPHKTMRAPLFSRVSMRSRISPPTLSKYLQLPPSAPVRPLAPPRKHAHVEVPDLLRVLAEGGALVVERDVDAELLAQVAALLGAAGDADDLGALELADLADERAGRAGRAGDDEGLARFDLADVEEALRRGERA